VSFLSPILAFRGVLSSWAARVDLGCNGPDPTIELVPGRTVGTARGMAGECPERDAWLPRVPRGSER